MTMRVIFINELTNIMNTSETLILKTLQYKAHNSGVGNARFVDHLLEQNPDQADEITKNVCARIPLELAQEMESLGSLLDLNKREIITLALNDFLAKAWATLKDYDAFPKGEEIK